MRIGSQEHKELFCRLFTESHQLYEPASLPWPDLDEASLARLRGVPFWQEVLNTELRAGQIVAAFAPTIDDPMLREAVALEGFEEARHAELLRVMVARYGIEATEVPASLSGTDVETAFIDFGFGECLDSFLGFGAFKIARQSEFLPRSMFDIFETLMYEETRHIVFFINWMAWREAQRGRRAVWLRGATSLWYYGRALRRLAGTLRRGADVNDGKDFSATQASVFLEGFTFSRFVADCHAENMRRMREFDHALLQPRLLPAIAGASLRALRLWHREHEPA